MINIAKLTAFDRECGGIARLAQRLVENSVPAAEEKKLLRLLGREEDVLLVVIARMLECLDRLGALTAQKELDLKPLRMFFLGVLAWTPATLIHAGIEDLSDAYEGFGRFNGIIPPAIAAPEPDFLTEMMQRFPDERVNHEKY